MRLLCWCEDTMKPRLQEAMATAAGNTLRQKLRVRLELRCAPQPACSGGASAVRPQLLQHLLLGIHDP